MAELEPSQEGRKRACPDPSEQTVLDAKSPGHAKKVRLEDKVTIDATDAVERLGREGKSVCEEEGENPFGLHQERQADGDSNGKDDGKTSNEAARGLEDPINEAEGTSAHRGKDSKQATVGPRCFRSSTDMLDFFYHLLHDWPLNLDINKYEHMMLEDLLKKGHQEWREKVGPGIKAFQVRINREFSSRCYYVIRTDGSTKDFSYRKCVENILPLPKLLKPHVNTSNQNEKGSKVLLNNTVSKAQVFKTQHNTKGRGSILGKDKRDGCGINGHIKGRGNHGRHGIGNLGGIRRGKNGGWGRGKHGGLGIGTHGGAGCIRD